MIGVEIENDEMFKDAVSMLKSSTLLYTQYGCKFLYLYQFKTILTLLYCIFYFNRIKKKKLLLQYLLLLIIYIKLNTKH